MFELYTGYTLFQVSRTRCVGGELVSRTRVGLVPALQWGGGGGGAKLVS